MKLRVQRDKNALNHPRIRLYFMAHGLRILGLYFRERIF